MALTAARNDVGAYIRGKLFMAGVDDRTPISTAIDVITVLVMDVPSDELKKWRQNLDAALVKVRPPARDTWGLLPDQQAEMVHLMEQIDSDYQKLMRDKGST